MKVGSKRRRTRVEIDQAKEEEELRHQTTEQKLQELEELKAKIRE